MKIKLLYLVILLLIFVKACQINILSHDNQIKNITSGNIKSGKRTQNFHKQKIRGKIGGIICYYESGTADDFNDKEIIINISLKNDKYKRPGKNYKSIECDRIGIYLPKKIGETVLSPTSQSVTLVDCSEHINYICLQGKIVLNEIDYKKKTIFGSLNAYYDSENFVSGLFELNYTESR